MQVQRVQFNTSPTPTLGVNTNRRAGEKKFAFKGRKQNWENLKTLLSNPNGSS